MTTAGPWQCTLPHACLVLAAWHTCMQNAVSIAICRMLYALLMQNSAQNAICVEHCMQQYCMQNTIVLCAECCA